MSAVLDRATAPRLRAPRLNQPELAKLADSLRLQLQRVAPLVKQAALGGEQETQFEQAFASLAYTYLKDRAPRLLDYLVGFQLVDRNDENTRAVGVFGFQVGRNWLYAPVFFLNGEIKGHELLYLKERDTFVPLKEGWINYVLSNQRRPSLGNAVQRNPQALGVRQPDLSALSQPRFSGGNKFASAPAVWPNVAKIGWAEPLRAFQPVYAALTAGAVEDSFQRGLSKAAGSLPSDLFDKLMRTHLPFWKRAYDVCEAYPLVKAAMTKWHGENYLIETLTEIRGAAEKQAARIDNDIAGEVAGVISDYHFGKGAPAVRRKGRNLFDETPNPNEKVAVFRRGDRHLELLNEAQAESLFRQGYLVHDKRAAEEKSEVYDVSEPLSLNQPDVTGVYEVLEKPFQFKKCLLIDAPFSTRRRGNFFTVVDMESKASNNVGGNCMYVKPQENSPTTWAEEFEKLPSASIEKEGLYVFVMPNGSGTCPLRIKETIDGDGKLYQVNCDDYAHLQRDVRSGYSGCCEPCFAGQDLLLLDSDLRGEIYVDDGTLNIPTAAKAIKLKSAALNKDGYYEWREEEAIRAEAVRPGSPTDVQFAIYNNTSPLKLRVTPHDASVNSDQMINKTACLLQLVQEHGLDEPQAREMLKVAEARDRLSKPALFRVVYAPGYPLSKQAYSLQDAPPTGPSIPQDQASMGMFGSLPATGSLQEQIPSQQNNLADPSVYDMSQPDQDWLTSMQGAQNAAQTGQKEVFDTTMLSGLLKNMRHDTLLMQYCGTLMKAVDCLGRILVILYWRNDAFAEQFGKTELPELEDSIRNSFEAVGDTTLFLLERDAGPLFGGQNQEINVDASAAL